MNASNDTVPLHIDGKAQRVKQGMAIWAMGFRPFFLLGAISAVLLVPIWVGVYRGDISGSAVGAYVDAITWHYHEMLFGFAVAVIAGFLLTAGSNWTGRPTARGKWLIALTGLWLAGRIVMVCGSSLPGWLIATVDLAFIPALAVALAIPVFAAGNRRNYVFIVLLGMLAAANLMVHLQANGVTITTARNGAFLAIYLVLMMITLVGGRVFPYFASKRLGDAKVKRYMPIEVAAVVALAGLMIAELAAPTATNWIAGLAIVAAVVHAVRFVGWLDRRVWGVPLLWVLYLGYAWMIIGFGLRAAAATGHALPFLATHAYTVGAIGVLTMGMMARVSLGHAGRAMQQSPITTGAFVLINGAAAVRVIGPLISPAHYVLCVSVSGALWTVAFALFVGVYAPILCRARVDGKAG